MQRQVAKEAGGMASAAAPETGRASLSLLRLWGCAGLKHMDKFREIGRSYVRYCPELKATARPPHDVVALPWLDCRG